MAQDGTVGNLDGRVVEFPNLATKSISKTQNTCPIHCVQAYQNARNDLQQQTAFYVSNFDEHLKFFRKSTDSGEVNFEVYP